MDHHPNHHDHGFAPDVVLRFVYRPSSCTVGLTIGQTDLAPLIESMATLN